MPVSPVNDVEPGAVANFLRSAYGSLAETGFVEEPQNGVNFSH